MDWTPEQHALIRRYAGSRPPRPENLTAIPPADRRYKCHVCHLILDAADLIDGACPVCGETAPLAIMCPLDHCHCPHDVLEEIAYCPICGRAVCPACGTHDVAQMSRVTGYIQDVGGWNVAKQQELKDRIRYDAGTLTADSAPEPAHVPAAHPTIPA
jgi:hypothetical protein